MILLGALEALDYIMAVVDLFTHVYIGMKNSFSITLFMLIERPNIHSILKHFI